MEPPKDAFTVEFRAEEQDFRAAYGRRRAAPDRWSQYYYYGMLPIFTAGLAVAIQSFIIAAFFMTLLTLAQSAWHSTAQRKQWDDFFRKYDKAQGHILWRVSLTDNGISISSVSQSSLYHWPYVNEVVLTVSHIFIVTASRREVCVPIRAFDGQEQVRHFVAKAREQIKKHAISVSSQTAK